MTSSSDIRKLLESALAEREENIASIGGCTNGNCIVQPPKGQHTNGGCGCYRNPHKMQRLAYANRRFVEYVRLIVETGK